MYAALSLNTVSLLINDNKCHEFGRQMIEVACKELDEDPDIFRTFIKCIQESDVDVEAPSNAVVIPRLNIELSKKMFHARINEYTSTLIELGLEKSGKAVDAEQSLRDQLETFSGLKKDNCVT